VSPFIAWYYFGGKQELAKAFKTGSKQQTDN